MDNKPIVFLGPSLPIEQARELLDVDYRPPVRRGDLDELEPGQVVGMIDGVFEQNLAVSYSEVHRAVTRGVRIMGASSMGALRAVEIKGVVGVGRIFEMFANGIIDSDDEVALLFDPASYRPLTVPLVNVRYAVQNLVRSRTVAASIGQRIVDSARGLFYKDRTYHKILEQADLLDKADAKELIHVLNAFDLKREDAQLLLEKLPVFAIASESLAVPEAHDTRDPHAYEDQFHDAKIQASVAATEPFLLWESGDRLDFEELVRFLILTARFDRYARSALARFCLEGNVLEWDAEELPTFVSGQSLFDRLVQEWGWQSAEEAHVTLLDLNIGRDTLRERFGEEIAARGAVSFFARNSSPEFLEALRFELLSNDISLKREGLRLGALKSLAARGRQDPSPLTADELRAARIVLREIHDVAIWNLDSDLRGTDAGVAAQVGARGVSTDELDAFIKDVAFARRAVRALSVQRAATGADAAQVPPHTAMELVTRKKSPGELRHYTPMATAYQIVQDVGSKIGVTRIGLMGELADLGIFIGLASRPDSVWSSTIGSGKGKTAEQAKVGSVMEECEKWAQEQFPSGHEDLEVKTASFAAMRRELPTVDPSLLDLPYDTSYHPDAEITWRPCHDLISNSKIWIPSDAIAWGRSRGDIYYSYRLGRKHQSTNGLASGLCLEEALLHATCEVIERHCTALAQLLLHNPGGFGPHPYRALELGDPSASVGELLERIERSSAELRVLDITSDIGVPTFAAVLFVEDQSAPWPQHARGWGTHPNPEVALEMAILEACQTVVGSISGGREDLSVRARSLGRHERPEPNPPVSRSVWHMRGGPKCTLEDIRGYRSDDIRDELLWVVERLRVFGVPAVAAVRYTMPAIQPVEVVRVLIPGLETNNPLYYGFQARMRMIPQLVLD